MSDEMKHTIAVDFDGVLHSYTSGWEGHTTISDPPVEGAIDWLNEIVKHCTVIVFTTRASNVLAKQRVLQYLRKHGYRGPTLEVTNVKPICRLFIDDRAWVFRGIFPGVEEIRCFEPWRTGDPS